MIVKDLNWIVGGDVVICDSETLEQITPVEHNISNHRFSPYWECEVVCVCPRISKSNYSCKCLTEIYVKKAD